MCMYHLVTHIHILYYYITTLHNLSAIYNEFTFDVPLSQFYKLNIPHKNNQPSFFVISTLAIVYNYYNSRSLNSLKMVDIGASIA